MALQENLNQVKAQAQAYAKQLQDQANALVNKVNAQGKDLQAQAKDLQAIVVAAADKSSDVVKTNANKLSGEADSVKGGYAAVLEQLKVFGNVRDVDSLKTAVQGRIEWLPKAGDAVEAEAKKVAEIVVKTGNDLGDVVKGAYAEATGAQKPAKKAAAKKPAAKKTATTAKKTVAKKATAAKKPVAKKATAAKKTVAKKATTAKKTVAKKAD